MSNLFASQLVGLEVHYRDIVANLSSIEKLANTIVKSKDYNDLPALGISYDIEEGIDDRAADALDVFWELRNGYDSYYDFAMQYFQQAPRSDHSGTLSRILLIYEAFDSLVSGAVSSEIDVLARLWFYQIAKNTANDFGATIEDEESKCYREMSNFKHLQHVTHYTIEKLQYYFGYLAEKPKAEETATKPTEKELLDTVID